MGTIPRNGSSLPLRSIKIEEREATSSEAIPHIFSEIDREEAILRSLEATGIGRWEALGHLVLIVGSHVARREWRVEIEKGVDAADAVRMLDEMAESDSDLAQELLEEWLRGRHIESNLCLNHLSWVRSIPAGLRVDGDLGLVGCQFLERVESDLTVCGSLALLGCCGLRELQFGLTVGKELDIRACPLLLKLPADLKVDGDIRLWPGIEIPSGSRIGGRIFPA